MQHVRDQNWTAIGIDFFIVVVGVFVGIQVSNWNDARVERTKERAHLGALREDIKNDIIDINQRIDDLAQVALYGNQVLTELGKKDGCAKECWPVIVRAFHASQWFDMTFQSSFNELQRGGPRNERLKGDIATYFLQRERTNVTNELPLYRELARSIIPIAAQTHLWANCYQLDGRIETMRLDCPPVLTEDESQRVIDAFRDHPQITSSLTYWLSSNEVTKQGLTDQLKVAGALIASIDSEIGAGIGKPAT
jgi:hypothetical protein